MKFKPEDFGKECDGMHSGCCFTPLSAAEIANAKLEEWLKSAPTVYGPQSLYGFKQTALQSWHTFKNPGHTHKAKLVQIEEL